MRKPLNTEATLFSVPAREIWQCAVISTDSIEVGRAVGLIIEPAAWCVRYIVLLDRLGSRRFLPASLVLDAREGCILCDIAAAQTNSLALYTEPLDRATEEAAHNGPGCQPYWLTP